MSRLNTQLFLFGALACFSVDALAYGWDDLWKRADQQINELIEQGSYDEAAKRADSPEQNALIKYRAGDYESSAELYEQSSDDYNRGTALTRSGDYAGAIEAYDQILADSVEYKDAMHNRKVAQKLAELQEQQQGEGEGDGDGEQEQPSQSGEQSPDSEGQSNDPSDNESDENQDSQPSDEPGEQSDQEPSDSPADNQQAPSPGESDENSESEAQPEPSPHDEEQQAMEQLLQRVPDDPAGLLRARIIREHQRNYSGSQDKEQAW